VGLRAKARSVDVFRIEQTRSARLPTVRVSR
jgi:hypothetical protein